jgi:hypothetical protein
MRYLSIVVLILVGHFASAQTKTTEDLHKNNKEAFTLFFYQNTLRMFNQGDEKEFDELIKDIEKMKFVMIDRTKFGNADYKKLVSGYKSEKFEEIMSSRIEGRNFDVFLKDDNGKTKGMVVTVNDTEKLFVLDIVGSIALNKVATFVKTLDENSDIADKIKSFTKTKE